MLSSDEWNVWRIAGRRRAGADDDPSRISCGEPILRDFAMPTTGCPVAAEDCQRRYMLYFPTSVCQGGFSVANSPLEVPSVTLPLVFSIHCLGCSLESLQHWSEMAELYQFVWVNPEGIQRSFNAGGESCCGYALEHGIDDVGFLKGIIEELSSQYSSFVSADWVYAMGWSNGGYLVSAATSLFRAIAPISGYVIEDLKVDRPTAIFLHHSADDRFVAPTGCCTDNTMPRCCCGISDHTDVCTSVEAQMNRWATEINGCETSSSPAVTWKSEDPDDSFTCYTYPACQANTTYCIHQNKGHFNHPSFQVGFTMNRPVADFFAWHMCTTSNNQSVWDGHQRVCTCPEDQTNGPYCFNHLRLSTDVTDNSNKSNQDTASSSTSSSSSTVSSTLTTGTSTIATATVTHASTRTNNNIYDDGTFKAEVDAKDITLPGLGEHLTLLGLLVVSTILCVWHRRGNRQHHWSQQRLTSRQGRRGRTVPKDGIEDDEDLIPAVEMRCEQERSKVADSVSSLAVWSNIVLLIQKVLLFDIWIEKNETLALI